MEGRWLYAIFAIGGIAMYILFGYLFYLSEILEERHGVHGLTKGILLAIPLSSICLASLITGKAIGQNKKRMKWLTVAGSALITAIMIVTAFAPLPGFVWMLILLTAAGAGIGLVLPCLDALITEGIDKKQRGTITSLYSSMRFIGVAAGPLLASLIWNNQLALFLMYAAVGILSCGLALFGIRPDHVGSDR